MILEHRNFEGLIRHLASLNLLGVHWVVSAREELVAALEVGLPSDKLSVGTPEDSNAMGDTSLVLLDPEAGVECTAMLNSLMDSTVRPLILVLSDGDDLPDALERPLSRMGYRLPGHRVAKASILQVEPAGLDHKRHFDVTSYWDSRYTSNRDSGAGSYGRLARFKAQFLNRFVQEWEIGSVVEFGCGDGAQLSLAKYPKYVGLDISQAVVEKCRRRFEGDHSKRFEHYNPECFDPVTCQAELALSLDVIYHLSNDRIYRQYLEHLFESAVRYVIVYSNSDQSELPGVNESAAYIRFRDFLSDVERWFPGWSLVSAAANRFPYSVLNSEQTSFADFYVFQKREQSESRSNDDQQVIDRLVLRKVLNTLSVADENSARLLQGVDRNEDLIRELSTQAGSLASGLANEGERAEVGRKLLSELIDSSDEKTTERFKTLHKSIERLQSEQQTEREKLFDSLNRCNELLQGQLTKLVNTVDERERQLEQAKVALHELRDSEVPDLERRLQEANAKAKQRINALSGDLDKVKNDLESARKHDIPALRKQVETERFMAERAVQQLKSSLTYRAGLCFREAAGSMRGLFRLPISLFRVWRQARQQSSGSRLQSGPQFRLIRQAPASEWIALGTRPAWQTIKLQGSGDVGVVGRVRVELASDATERCGLVRIEYLDARNQLIIARYPRTSFSSRVGQYRYLNTTGDVEVEEELFRLRPPKGARAVRLGFQSWHCEGQLLMRNELSLANAKATHRRISLPEFTPPSAAVQEAGALGWPKPPDNGKSLVLGVMDEFTESCFSEDLRLVQPRPDNWYALAMKYRPVMVFVESAWKGNGGSWQYRVGTYSIKPGRELEEMLAWARQEGIPSIFWNKEDPVHHEKFMEAASLAEHVFTTDRNMVDSYKERTGNPSVHSLPFAAQPSLHKPAPLEGRIARACFAGSWYGDRHVERGEAMKWLLRAALEHGLDIFDRNHGTGLFPFPEAYREGIRGGLPYRELCREYARYRLFLNVNSVTDSPTMFSRRVFELMACGTPVVSTPARGLDELFQTGAVWVVRNKAEADEAITTLLTDDDEWRRRSLAGIREVFQHHTYAHRINQVFRTVGLNDRINTEPRVLLVGQAERPEDADRLTAIWQAQSYGNAELMIVCDNRNVVRRIRGAVETVRPAEMEKRLAADTGKVAAIGWLSGQHQYGNHYLQDLVNAMAYRPEAVGWAKSTEVDTFRYEGNACFGGSLWRPDAFLERWTRWHDGPLSDSGLFVIDSEEFSPSIQHGSVRGREHV